MTGLVVETDEPQWSVNVKKALASHLQLDVTGVRTPADETLGGAPVFGERSSNSLLETYEVSGGRNHLWR